MLCTTRRYSYVHVHLRIYVIHRYLIDRSKSMLSQTCDVKGCLDKSDQVFVVYHYKYMESESQVELCKFNPYEDNEDGLHCIIRFCDRHADKFRKQQETGNLEKSEIKFRDSIHMHR